MCAPLTPTPMKAENPDFEIALSYSMKSVLWGESSFWITETEVFCTELKGLPVKSSIFKDRDTQKGCRTAASVCRGNQDRVNTWSLTRQRRGQRCGQLCSHLLWQWLTSFPALSMFSGNHKSSALDHQVLIAQKPSLTRLTFSNLPPTRLQMILQNYKPGGIPASWFFLSSASSPDRNFRSWTRHDI